MESTKDEVATFKSTKADLERQLDVVNEEFTLAKTQMDAKWTLFQELSSSMTKFRRSSHA
ncbi:MAG: hypothetical protein HC767_11720 [Akkermansiaceae bacterium]|nr:hypothetical protein [Akkermansiaceae bacterium]